MSKFKAGDKVVCILEVPPHIKVGDTYVLTKVSADGGSVWIEDDYDAWASARFKLASELVCNGVDSAGNPLNFTENLLQPFQRVVDRAGRTWIVGPKKPNGKYALLDDGSQGHMEFYNTVEEASEQGEYVADEVYDIPMYYNVLDHAEKGNLIWKRKAPQTPQEKAVEDIENAIKQLEKDLEALKATL